ncbi:hypothetical protein [Novosphingobium sp. 9U]
MRRREVLPGVRSCVSGQRHRDKTGAHSSINRRSNKAANSAFALTLMDRL